ncbi:hypothetical protein Lepto7375DRAFT_5403 [Leptolyngbya sp. PCC 7375]|nr:hypothetical protein Lepto7375DRAFT_5403 [Leptolyngbya sp. PCC 7375]
MTVDELVDFINSQGQKKLSSVKELILRQAWEGATYASMAQSFHYEADYLKKVASELWQFLSDTFGEPVNKTNIRTSFELRPLALLQQQIEENLNWASFPSTPPPFKAQFPGSALSLDSSMYISRPPLEELACHEITMPGGLVRIKAPKRMGKSSLIIRMLAHATKQQYQVVYLDFQSFSNGTLENLTKFLRWFCASISRQLDLEPKLDDYWDEEIGSGMSCTLYLKRYVLSKLTSPLVLVLNEADQLFTYTAIAQGFFPLLRSWHEEAKRLELLQNLRLVVAYSTEAYIPLNVNQSPFNVGLPIKLPPFTLSQIQDLALRYGLSWAQKDSGMQQLLSLQVMTGGHPYLVQLALYHLCQGVISLEQLLQNAPTLSGIYSDHLRSYLNNLQVRPELMTALKQVVTANQSITLTPKFAYELHSMGLVTLKGNQISPSCDLYRIYFQLQLP